MPFHGLLDHHPGVQQFLEQYRHQPVPRRFAHKNGTVRGESQLAGIQQGPEPPRGTWRVGQRPEGHHPRRLGTGSRWNSSNIGLARIVQCGQEIGVVAGLAKTGAEMYGVIIMKILYLYKLRLYRIRIVTKS